MKGVYNEDASDKVASDNFGSILCTSKCPNFTYTCIQITLRLHWFALCFGEKQG